MRQILCLAFLLLPVAAAPDDKPADDPHKMKPDHAPTPFTAEEIRKACPEGRVDVYEEEFKGVKSSNTHKIVKCDENGAEIELTTKKADGTVFATQTHNPTWKQMQSAGSFPESLTKITEETIEVPAGKFDCWLYTVTDPKKVRRHYFAKKLPGPAIQTVIEVDGKVISKQTLVEHKEPAAEKPAPGEKPAG